MNFDSKAIVFKNTRWNDDLRKDNTYFGVGSIINQTCYENGHRESQPNEDRWFNYELKDNQIYAYGILDGYNGTWAVDLLNQYLLSNLYFDNKDSLQLMDDESIFSILNSEFSLGEQFLTAQSEELLLNRASRTILLDELRRGTPEYLENKKEIKNLDKQLNIGAFAIISLIVDDRLFVSNVGTSHCFVCLYNKDTNEKKCVSLETEHNLDNIEEVKRLNKLNVNLDKFTIDDENTVSFTRCIGDFRLKYYYHEVPQFTEVNGPPIICSPEHPSSSIKLDDSFLFMAMYSDGLAKAIEKTKSKKGNASRAILSKMIIDKIINEQTLNSAAQAVVDEIRRDFDDKFSNKYIKREDFTLAIRIFDSNIKVILKSIENLKENQQVFVLNDLQDTENTSIEEDEYLRSTINVDHDDSDSKESSRNSFSDRLDENDNVKPYVNFDELDKLLEENEEIFDKFCADLEKLAQ